MANRMAKCYAKQFSAWALALLCGIGRAAAAQAYSFNMIVPDVWQPAAISGGSACPVPAHQLTTAGSIAIQWSTALNTNPVTILTQNQTASGRLTEIEQTITQSLSVWTGVTGTLLLPGTFMPLTRTVQQNACGADGLNSICYDQMDMAFTPGVLAFTRVIPQTSQGSKSAAAPFPPNLGGRIIPANPLALPAFPPGVTGVFGAQIAAVDNATGAVIAATLGGWSCTAPGPAQFDGTYQISGLPVGSSHTVYAEALNDAASPSQFSNALTSLCRNAMTDAGWPPLQACIVPPVDISFTTRTRPGP